MNIAVCDLIVLLIIVALILIIKFKLFKIKLNLKKLENCVAEIKQRQLLNKYSKYLDVTNLNIISLIIFGLAYLLFNNIYNSCIISLIQAFPLIAIPYIVLSIVIQIERYNIIKTLPNFCINIKNQMIKNNNIILAIKNIKVLPPLKKYVDQFIINVNNSMDVSVAFATLKKQVDVKEFSELISLFQICYQNGGDFVNILEKYIKFLLNKISNKEKEKQDAYSSILILVIMVIMNIFIMVFFIIKNVENKEVILGTPAGNLILLLNVLSYIYCLWAVLKIYRME